MRTTIDIIDILYQVLNVPAVTDAISGAVYKGKRPIASGKVDIVIGSLPINANQVQQTVANVNIHVPNLQLQAETAQDDTQADYATLRAILAIVIPLLTDKSTPEYWFDVQQQQTFSEDDIREHYANIRVNFYSINL